MQLYPSITPYHDFHLSVGEGHQLHVQEYGEPSGLPVVICHGGPGLGLHSDNCRFFDPNRYRIILYSQRGCGLSSPYQLTTNNTDYLIADLEYLRQSLGIGKWSLCGASWGATICLLYAIKHHKNVASLLLRGTFLATNSDLQWIYGADGAGAQFYPELYEQFAQKQADVKSILALYQQQLNVDDQISASHYAKLWCQWESVLSQSRDCPDWTLNCPQHGLNMARLMVHYFSAQCFIEEQFILNNSQKLAHIPIWFIHGRHDLVCRFSAIQKFAKQLHAQLLVLDEIGHGVDSQVYLSAVRRAADHMYIKLSRDQCKG
ncbi:alpha/beta fold hydrolase [Pseudoalteromonas sp. SaAl2]